MARPFKISTPAPDLGRDLIDAILGDDAQAVALAIQRGADLNVRANRVPALVLAVRNASLECVEILALAGAELDAQDGDGWSCAIRAAARGRLDVLELLASLGADLDLLSARGRSALGEAVAHGQPTCVDFLISQGVRIDVVDAHGLTPSMLACMDAPACLRSLINAGADLSLLAPGGVSLLSIAQANHAGACEALLLARACEAELDEDLASGRPTPRLRI